MSGGPADERTGAPADQRTGVPADQRTGVPADQRTSGPADQRTGGPAVGETAGHEGGRILAVDWGRKRFGVALSDPGRLIAQPLATLARREGQRPPIAALLELIREHDVTELVVGLPLSPEGEEGETAAEVRTFGDALARRAALPLTFWDERLSTSLALRSARAAGVKDRDSRARIDQMAAVAILQHFLDARRARGAE